VVIRRYTIPQIVCSGSDGSATGTGASSVPINGKLLAIHLNHSTGAVTSDVTVATTQAPTQTLTSKANSVTDGWFYPVVQSTGAVDGAAVSGAYAPLYLDDYVTVSVAQANGAQTLDVTLLVDVD